MTKLTTYIGTKIIQAAPMPGPHGALYHDQDGYQVVYEDGYTSWSPKDVFEKAYRKTDAMTFGDALIMMQAGKTVVRASEPDMPVKIVYMGGFPSFVAGPSDRPIMLWGPACAQALATDWQVVE